MGSLVGHIRLGVKLMALVIVTNLIPSCKQEPEVLKSPPGYDFSKPEITRLDDDLLEISGVAWDPDKNEFAAVSDEAGKIYFLDKESKIVRNDYNFASKGDFEGIAYAKGIPYIMKSNGQIYQCFLDSLDNITATDMGKPELEGSVDFESLYFDSTRNSLVLLCKNCESDNKEKVSAYAFSLDSNKFSSQPLYQIDVNDVAKRAPKKAKRFQPSDAAIHPVQKKLYILSHGSNQLVITDLSGKVEKVFVLAAYIFPQPEGICFKKNGDMYISNEGLTGKASLLKFTYRRQ